MKFTALASSSRGNAYLLESDGAGPLLLEAGIPIKKLREGLYAHGISISDLSGCLVSHEHLDHSKAVKDLLKAGVDVYTSVNTAIALNVEEHHRMNFMNDGISQPIGAWRVMPFDLKHDAAEPFGYLVAYDTEALMFIADTAYIKNRFEAVTIIAVECNHVGDILAGNIARKDAVVSLGRRVRRNHMSLETLIKMLKANDLSQCREIHLLHLSDSNSDEKRMILEVQEATGIPTYACDG